MFEKTIGAIALTLMTATSAQADLLGDLDGVEDQVNSMMDNEMGGIIGDIGGLPPIIDCGCPHLCGFIAAMTRGVIPADQLQKELITALIQDEANMMMIAVRNGGKFDPNLLGRTTVKLEYADGFNADRAAEMMKRAAEVAFR